MKVGDRVSVPFAGGTKEGVVVKVCQKTVWLKVDFPRHPGKLIRRKIGELEAGKAAPKDTKRKLFDRKG